MHQIPLILHLGESAVPAIKELGRGKGVPDPSTPQTWLNYTTSAFEKKNPFHAAEVAVESLFFKALLEALVSFHKLLAFTGES